MGRYARLVPNRFKQPAKYLIAMAVLAGMAGYASYGANKDGPKTTSAAPVAVTGNPHVDRLLNEMTFEEKIGMIHGEDENPATFQGQAGYLEGVPRLGIPSLRFADGPPGVLTRVPSTALTATMGLAATFSREDARENGIVIARDARSLGIDVTLQPFINIDRDLSFDRGYNTFGEDPLLTGQMAAAEIRGIQGEGILAQAKHYVGYDGGTDVVIGQQALHEIYVAPFVDVVNAGVASIMCSYNKINGPYSCNNSGTLKTILRDQVGFQGFLTSDWGANHTLLYVNDGLDMEMPGPFVKDMTEGMRKAVDTGEVNETTIDRAVGRILCQLDRFGLLDGKGKHDITPIDSGADAPIVQKTGEDAAVLLKNRDNTLPLTKKDLDSLALIGPGAGQTIAIGIPDEKAVGIHSREIGPWYALTKDTAGDPEVHIRYAVADDRTGTAIPAQFFSRNGKPGLVRTSGTRSAGHIDAEVNFAAVSGHALPANSTYNWDGMLRVPVAGSYLLYLQNLGCFASFILDGSKVASNEQMVGHGIVTQAGQDSVLPTTDGLDNLPVKIDLTAGLHRIRVSVQPDMSNQPTQVRLSWVTPEQQKANYDAAIAAAKHSHMAIVFAWGADNPVFQLAGDQDRLIADVAAVNPNTVVVLNISQPVAMPWLPNVKSVLLMWFPGDEGGWATANVLLGNVSPAGRLPFTWSRQLDQGVANDPAHPERESRLEGKGTTRYAEGIFVGYRWYDQQKLEPLFPFGFGLSYTRFEYSNLRVTRAADHGLDVHFTLKNNGPRTSDEVPQVYLDAPEDQAAGGTQFALHALAAFDRVHVAAGESRVVALHLPLRSLQYWSDAGNQWELATGPRKVRVGASSRDLRLEATSNIEP